MHTEKQVPWFVGSALKVPGVWGDGVDSYSLLSQPPTHVEVELGCDNDSDKFRILGYPERSHNHCFNLNCFRLHYFLLRSSSIFQKLRSSSTVKS